MSAPKKPESSTRERQLAAVPKAWLAVLTVLLVVPWLVVVAMYFSGSRPAARPAASEPVTESSAAAGPWGRLTTTPIIISPPLEYVSDDWGGWHQGPQQWSFPGVAREELEAFLVTAGMPRDQVGAVLASTKFDPAMNGLIATPAPETIRGLSPQLRARLYLQLAKTTRNFDQSSAFRFFGPSAEAWLRGSLMSPESRRIIEPLIYPDGGYVRFSDVELVRSQVKEPEELRRIAKTFLRQSTMVVKLTVNDRSEVPALADYWGRGGRRTDIRPLLESIAEGGSEHAIDIVHLLPTLAREHLYRYPRISTADLDKPLLANCLWSSLNFFQNTADDRFLDVNTALETLRREYFVVESGFQLGDIVALVDDEGNLFHVAVYLAGDLVFTKNGTSPMAPWIIAPLDRVKEYYHTRSTSPRLIYHRKNDL